MGPVDGFAAQRMIKADHALELGPSSSRNSLTLR